jgi:EF hand
MSISTTTNGINAIAQEIMRVFDRNKDGQLNSAEFASVLSTLVGGSATASAGSGAGAAAAPRTDQLAGFAPEKLATSQSTKYKFARAAMEFDVSQVKSKADAETLLREMQPAMAREGLDVLEVSKDRIKVMHEGAPIWIDVIRAAASGAGTSFQWLPE